jgi:hypothetical protein
VQPSSCPSPGRACTRTIWRLAASPQSNPCHRSSASSRTTQTPPLFVRRPPLQVAHGAPRPVHRRR